MEQQAHWQRRGPKGYKRSDERIKEDISEHLMHSAHIDASEVTIEVKDGKVTLEGTVLERRMKHAIEDMAEACPGVMDVENRIRVAHAGSHRDSSHGGSWGTGGSSGPTSTGTGSTTHGAGSSVGGTGTSSSTSPGSGTSGQGTSNARESGSAGMAGQSASSSSTAKQR